LERKGQSAMGQDYDDCVIVPIKAFQTKIQGGLGKFISGMIMVSAISSDQTARAQEQMTVLLRDRHHLQAGVDDDFFIRNLTEIASAQEQGAKTMSILLACIAFVSLLVGGIGIMNIMLVSVTERTREIGVRMAIGARPGDILWQFLVEALTLSFGGGVIGMLLGVLIAQVIPKQFQWPTLIRPDSILIAMVVSAAIGIAFGLYPARKASRLDPIDALRYE
jgi:putative ABC transport system permease protein